MRWRVLAVAAVLAAAARPVPALVMERMTLGDLVREAAVVVHGTVVGRACRYADPPAHGRIVTDYTVRVAEVVLGSHQAPTIVVTLPGGEVGDDGQAVPGVPRLLVGDEVVLFLRAGKDASVGRRHGTVGLAQGVFFVTRPGAGAAARAAQRMAGVAVLREAAEGRGIDLDLDDLLRTVRAAPARQVPQ